MPTRPGRGGLVDRCCISGSTRLGREYRDAMRRRKSLLRITVDRWGPVATGGSRRPRPPAEDAGRAAASPVQTHPVEVGSPAT